MRYLYLEPGCYISGQVRFGNVCYARCSLRSGLQLAHLDPFMSLVQFLKLFQAVPSYECGFLVLRLQTPCMHHREVHLIFVDRL